MALLKTAGALGLLALPLPGVLAVTAAALAGTALRPRRRETAVEPLTVLVNGGKMSKSLQLARSFHAAGHRVVLAESAKYRLTGHRFSSSVDRFYALPGPTSEAYATALLDIVQREQVDVFVPVDSPVASLQDARAKDLLAPHCKVLHLDADLVALVDDKEEFAALAASFGLRVPDSHRVTSAAQVTGFAFPAGVRYLLKSIAYDPVRRLDLTLLPLETAAATEAFVSALPISEANPWILQEFVTGQEFCTHSTVRDGEVTVFCCSPSSPFQVNYASVDKPEIEEWVRRFAAKLGCAGQLSFDFIESGDGQAYAIECNPRTHSAITMFHDHPGLAAAYLGAGGEEIRPLPSSRATYWLYHELWRILRDPRSLPAGLRVIAGGKEAVFDVRDPLPFLVENHVQIPWLLLRNLLRGSDWHHIDFNIGKLAEPDGD